MNHTTQPSFHEELAAHLAPQEHPKPHPVTHGASSILTADERNALAVAILRLRAEDAKKKLAALRGELPKPTGPVNEQFTPRVNWWGAGLIGYLLVAAGALAVGLVRGCAA